ncbi:MAG: ion transporter [Rubripirellula sp.]|nr:ion transporter [Rubripirellula sp.]
MGKISEARWNTVIRWVDRIAKPVVVFSIIIFLIEEELALRNHLESSYEASPVFKWCEWLIVAFFSFEFFVRWLRSNPRFYNAPTTSYPFNAWGAIDLLSFAPFWVGLFLPISFSGVIRSFRILRLLKFFRYSRTLQLTALKFYRAYHNLKGMAFSIAIVWLFFTAICLDLEHKAQPDKFGSLLDGAWFTIVTATTVGYGDASPVGVWGKLFVGAMLIPIISTMGMAFSAFSTACDTVQAIEDDPDVDPLNEWQKERERMRKRKKANREYRMDE